MNDEEVTRLVPLAEMLAERKKRQAVEKRVKELEATEFHKVNQAFRIALVALGGASPSEPA